MKSMLIFFVFVPSLVFAGELADLYQRQEAGRTHDFRHSQNHKVVESNKHAITEIGLERGMCFGSCPVYTVIIKSDGTFKYTGYKSNSTLEIINSDGTFKYYGLPDYKFADKLGDHTGTVSTWKLKTLLQFINDSEYDSLRSAYSKRITDHPKVYTMVKNYGKIKIVYNYANSGPAKLWAIEQLIDNLLLKAKWDQKK